MVVSTVVLMVSWTVLMMDGTTEDLISGMRRLAILATSPPVRVISTLSGLTAISYLRTASFGASSP